MKTEFKVGDEVIVRSDLYLGQWITAGGKGRIVRIGNNDDQLIYHVDIKGVQYSFVRSELLDAGKPVQCPECQELHELINDRKASMMPSKCYPVGGSPCPFLKLNNPEVCHDDPYEVHKQIRG